MEASESRWIKSFHENASFDFLYKPVSIYLEATIITISDVSTKVFTSRVEAAKKSTPGPHSVNVNGSDDGIHESLEWN